MVNSDKSDILFVHSPRTARVFTGVDAKGNLCVVRRFSSALDARNHPLHFRPEITPCTTTQCDTSQCATTQCATTQCATWQEGDDVHVKCWTADGRSIACCGHGLMACAALWREQADNHVFPLTLRMNGSRITVDPPIANQSATGTKPAFIELRFETMVAQPCELPNWLDSFFPHLPYRCATAGGESGYMVLEWPAQYDLRCLPVPAEHLEQVTQRAIIVTCLMSSVSPMIHFRYFAPQYGTPEDSATGSAMRVLAGYWLQQQSLTRLQAFQCSPSGGILHSRIERNHVVIGGSVEWE